MAQRKTATGKTLGFCHALSTVWAMYRMGWWTRTHMDCVSAWPLPSCWGLSCSLITIQL